MNKKKILRVSIFAIFMVLMIFSTIVRAGEIDPTTIVSEPDPGGGVNTLFDVGNIILGIFQAVGVGVAVIATLVLSIRYMYSSPEDKATIKKQLIPYIIGGVLVFGAVTLVKLAQTLSGELL